MFGKLIYRYPKLYFLISALRDLWLPCVLQFIIIIRWALWSHNYPLMLISTVPCITVILAVNKFIVYSKMYNIAYYDPVINSTLLEFQQISKHDYLLWVTMEAYKLYLNKNREEIEKTTTIYRNISYAIIVFQLIFMPVLV